MDEVRNRQASKEECNRVLDESIRQPAHNSGSCECIFFFSSRRRHTRLQGDWSSDVCSSDLDSFVEDANLTQHIYILRKTLEDTASREDSIIRTIPKQGYMFTEPVRVKVACGNRSEEHTSELQSPCNIVCRLLLAKKMSYPLM